VTGVLVSPEYFSTLKAEAMFGRVFSPELDKAGAPAGVVVTERFWRTWLHSDPHIVGRELRVNGLPIPILGVCRPGFFGTGTGSFSVPEIFVPVTAGAKVAPELRGDALSRTTDPAFWMLLRLAPGVTLPAAEARLEAQARALDGQRHTKDRLVHLVPAGTVMPLPPELRVVINLFYGVLVAAVLRLTCANLGGLLLARGAARTREFAIRLSIGARRGRLVRQLLTESGILAMAGGVAGLAAASVMFRVLRSMQTGSNELMDVFMSGPDLNVALFAFVIAAVAAIGFGLLPALSATRIDLASAIKTSLVGGRAKRFRVLGLRNIFVVGQVASAMMLLLMIGFLLVGARYGSKTDPGFDIGPVSFFSVDPARDGMTEVEGADALRRLPERIAALPGVESVSLADNPPANSTAAATLVSAPSVGTQPVAVQKVGPGFLRTIGATILRGKDDERQALGPVEAAGTMVPVAINQSAAEQLFGKADPLGRRIDYGPRVLQVAAVVRYLPRTMVQGQAVPTVLLPLTAKDLESTGGGLTVIVRAHTPVPVATLRHALAAADSRLTLSDARSMREYIEEADRVSAKVAASYAPIGLFGAVLACLWAWPA
jgi:predicted permease